MDWIGASLILIIAFSITPAYGAKKADRAAVESFVQEYVSKVAKKDLAAVFEEDAEEFESCAQSSCKAVLRKPVAIKVYDEDDEDAPEEEMFEVHMDVFKSGDLLARRSGCYMVMKTAADHLVMKQYQYDCAE